MKIIAILEQGPTYNYVAHLYFIVPRNRLSQITSRKIVLVRKYSNRCYKPYRIAGISKDFVINRNCIDILKFHNQDQTFFTSHFLLSRQVSFNGLCLLSQKTLFWWSYSFLNHIFEYCIPSCMNTAELKTTFICVGKCDVYEDSRFGYTASLMLVSDFLKVGFPKQRNVYHR